MKLSDAEAQWVEAKLAIKAAEALMKPAKEALLEHFRKTGKGAFKRVGYSTATYLALDTDAVRVELADRLDKFEVVRDRETLSLLGS